MIPYRSGLPNAPGGAITTLDFIVKIWLCDIAFSLLTLFCFCHHRFWVEQYLQLASKVLSDSSLKLILCVLLRDEHVVLEDLIFLSLTPPILLAIGGFFFHIILSDLFSSKKYPIFPLSIFIHAFSSSFSAPAELLQLSQWIDLMLPCLAMKCWSARMNST